MPLSSGVESASEVVGQQGNSATVGRMVLRRSAGPPRRLPQVRGRKP